MDQENALAEAALHDAKLDELDVEGVVGFAEHVLSNAARLWLESSLDQRQRLQKVLFPKGVTYSPDGQFGTAETLSDLQASPGAAGRKDKRSVPDGI